MEKIKEQLQQAEDRVAIRELVDAYANCADTRDAQGQMYLFTEDTNFEVYMDAKSPTPTQIVQGRANLFPVFDNLNSYQATMHFNGQSTIKFTGAGKASGLTYCLAHHLTVKDGKQNFMVAAIRYYDIFVKREDRWLFAERKLLVSWIEQR
ncbi:MAG: nuclear transport factor 2 family protein [Bacteroidetes bacterium]|nr:nuclear transport factor 2 family protein [Bacteroidota bacterium]